MMHEKEMEIIAKRKEEHLENERIKEQFSKELQVLSENLRKNLSKTTWSTSRRLKWGLWNPGEIKCITLQKSEPEPKTFAF